MKAKIYKTRHIHLDETPEYECIGNPKIHPAEVIESYRHVHNNWCEDERTGVITSDGDEDWQAERKTFLAVPIFESEAAIPYHERQNFDPINLCAEYRLEIVPNWDAIPDFIKSDPFHLASLEALKKEQTWARVDVWQFVIAPDVTNLTVGQDGTISGYDHGSETQYTFFPKS